MERISARMNSQAGRSLIVVLVVLVGIVVGVIVFSRLNLSDTELPGTAEEDLDQDAIIEMIRQRSGGGDERDEATGGDVEESDVPEQAHADGETEAGEDAVDPPAPAPAPAAPIVSYSGTRLAGSAQVPLLAFTQEDYDKAVAAGEVVVLMFHANWCPYCQEEAPDAEAAFDQLGQAGVDGIVGFRVNYNDDETDQNERALATAFNVTYQNSKVIVKGGETLTQVRFTQWSTGQYLAHINAALE
jgi:thiol-disulfide isomerase/thioredoxin